MFNFYESGFNWGKGLLKKGAKKSVDTVSDLTLGNISRLTKWTARSIFKVLVGTGKAAAKGIASLPIVPGK
jgi:hypothetical protein